MDQRTVIQTSDHLIIKDIDESKEDYVWCSAARCQDNWHLGQVSMAMDPVLTQPGLGVTTKTVTTITQTGGDWSTGLFDISGDGTTCVLGAAAPCCLDMSVAHQYGETLCLPLLPGSTLALRVGIRERYKIRGSICDDWVTVCCCYPLAVSQMIREMRRRMKRQTYKVSTTLQCS